MKNRIIGIIFLIAFALINLWGILTKNYSNSLMAGIAGMCLGTAIIYLKKENSNSTIKQALPETSPGAPLFHPAASSMFSIKIP